MIVPVVNVKSSREKKFSKEDSMNIKYIFSIVAMIAVMTICQSALVGNAFGGSTVNPRVDPNVTKMGTCSTIDEQIQAARALEDYAKSRFNAYVWSGGGDHSVCHHAAEFYKYACKARNSAEALKYDLCDDGTLWSESRDCKMAELLCP